jgi:hypothetical protein
MKLVKISETEIRWLDSKIDGLEMPSDERISLAARCQDMAREHHKAIVRLIANSLHGSAFSLIRPMFEAHTRGSWLYRCATDRDVEKYKKETLEKSFTALVSEVDGLPEYKLSEYKIGAYSKIKEMYWKIMNSYVHCGYDQTASRIKGSSIEPNYNKRETEQWLYFASSIGFVSAFEISMLAKNFALQKKILRRFRAFPVKNYTEAATL